MKNDGIEREFKLRARAPIDPAQVDAIARELGLDVSSSSRQPHCDDYFDDASRSLARAGIGLRRRQSGEDCTLCLKSTAEVRDGLLLRREVEAPWQGPMPATAALLPPVLRAKVEPFTLDRPLLPILQLQTGRELHHFTLADGSRCELAIDPVVASADARSAPFTEIEVEVADDTQLGRDLVQRLCEQLPLSIAIDSKLEHAQALLGLPAIEDGPLELQAMLGLGTALRLVLRLHLLDQRHEEAGVRLDLDSEFLHRMRVANRRMRALVRAFPDLWLETDAAWLRQHLANTGHRLGALRDLDVTLAELEPLSARIPAPLLPHLERLRQLLATQRQEQLSTARTFFEHEARLADERRLEQLLIDPPAPAGEGETTPVAQAVLRHLGKAARTVRRLGNNLPPELPIANVHELRVAIKRLRYLLEDFLPALPQDLHKAAPRLAHLQQKLGEVCDHDLGAQHFLELLAAIPDGDAQLAALIGSLATIHQGQSRAARKRAARSWNKTARRRFWEAFEAADDT